MAQNYLVFHKVGTTKRFRISEGDELIYNSGSDESWSRGEVMSLTDSLIKMESGFVRMSELNEVLFLRKGRQAGAVTIMTFGAGYFLFDQFNNSVIAGQRLSLDEQVNKTTGVIIGVGLLVYFSGKKKIRIGKKWKVSILNFDSLREPDSKN